MAYLLTPVEMLRIVWEVCYLWRKTWISIYFHLIHLVQVLDSEEVLPPPQRQSLVGKISEPSWSLHTSKNDCSFFSNKQTTSWYLQQCSSFEALLSFCQQFSFQEFCFRYWQAHPYWGNLLLPTLCTFLNYLVKGRNVARRSSSSSILSSLEKTLIKILTWEDTFKLPFIRLLFMLVLFL